MSEPQTNTTLDAVKLAMAITTDAYDAEISALITAALLDLGVSGVITTEPDALVLQAVKTYCRMNFQSPPDYDRLAESYRSQKSLLMCATGYTNWGAVHDPG